eukprot:1155913-Pelagomonas_calceolata.AAC.1
MIVYSYGDIGQACARLARAFKMHVVGLRRRAELSEKEKQEGLVVSDKPALWATFFKLFYCACRTSKQFMSNQMQKTMRLQNSNFKQKQHKPARPPPKNMQAHEHVLPTARGER